MFTLSRLRRARKKIDADYSRELAKLRKAKASPEQFGKLEFEHSTAANEYADDIAIALSARLLGGAYKYDVEVPEFSDRSIWTGKRIGPNEFRHWLSPLGRSHVRKLIDEEKARRFEVKALGYAAHHSAARRDRRHHRRAHRTHRRPAAQALSGQR